MTHSDIKGLFEHR